MVSCDIHLLCEIFSKYQGLMGHKEETLRKLFTQLQTTLGDCQVLEIGFICDLGQVGC